MTERFDAEAQQTTQGQSGVGPSITVTSLTALGVGQGSGQSATAQERNSSIAFEFPIRWDDISANLARLDQKKYLEEVVDDMTTRDQQLENFLNTNVVSGIVAGSNITISRATGVVTISAPNAVTASTGTWTPNVTFNSSSASGSYYMVGKLMAFEILVFLTGTANGANTIYVTLPTGTYGTTAGAIETRIGQTPGTVYAGTADVTFTGSIAPYNVGTNGALTDIANFYNGTSLAGKYLKIRGVIYKSA